MGLRMALAGILIAVGALRIIIAFEVRALRGWFWPLASGLIPNLLGILITVPRWLAFRILSHRSE
jgi:uncharacterized membrane protein HdeD (DUF308 family)